MRTLSKKEYQQQYLGFSSPCWIWLRHISHTGHGRAWCSRRRKVIGAHVLLFERYAGQIPRGYELHHLCFQRACVNPSHLIPVTRKQHMDLEDRKPFGNPCAGSATKRITHNGRTLTLRQWSQDLGLSEDTVYRRIHNYGWPEKLAVSTPLIRYRRAGKPNFYADVLGVSK